MYGHAAGLQAAADRPAVAAVASVDPWPVPEPASAHAQQEERPHSNSNDGSWTDVALQQAQDAGGDGDRHVGPPGLDVNTRLEALEAAVAQLQYHMKGLIPGPPTTTPPGSPPPPPPQEAPEGQQGAQQGAQQGEQQGE